jgi:hypothetical protein
LIKPDPEPLFYLPTESEGMNLQDLDYYIEHHFKNGGAPLQPVGFLKLDPARNPGTYGDQAMLQALEEAGPSRSPEFRRRPAPAKTAAIDALEGERAAALRQTAGRSSIPTLEEFWKNDGKQFGGRKVG